jgi:C4-dicarboxylate transporter DctM subunit
VATVTSCLIFGGVSGSAIADTAAIGSVMAPAMIFAIGLSLDCVRVGKITGCDPGGARAPGREIWSAFVSALPALLMPVIILGGIWTGFFTPTEAAAVAAAYGLFVAMVIYGDLRPRDLPALLLKSFTTSAVIMVVIGATSSLAWLITVEQVPAQIADMVTHCATSQWTFLLVVNFAMLALGCFIEPVPALILAAPLLVPLSVAFKVDPVHLGLIMTCNLAIGLYTPPVGGTLMVGARLAGVGMVSVVRSLIPQMMISVSILLVITYFPAISMSLVRALR